MIEYWAVIGLASLDSTFRSTLKEKATLGQDAVEQFLKEEGFRLSRYENGEVTRLLRISGVVEAMTKLHDSEWEQGRVCWTAKIPKAGYRHPDEQADGSVVLLDLYN